MKQEGWGKATSDEIKALEDQGTWVLQPLPPGKKALGSKRVYIQRNMMSKKIFSD